jgi:hypothetical protein
MNSSLLSGIFNGCNGSTPGIDRIGQLPAQNPTLGVQE